MLRVALLALACAQVDVWNADWENQYYGDSGVHNSAPAGGAYNAAPLGGSYHRIQPPQGGRPATGPLASRPGLYGSNGRIARVTGRTPAGVYRSSRFAAGGPNANAMRSPEGYNEPAGYGVFESGHDRRYAEGAMTPGPLAGTYTGGPRGDLYSDGSMYHDLSYGEKRTEGLPEGGPMNDILDIDWEDGMIPAGGVQDLEGNEQPWMGADAVGGRQEASSGSPPQLGANQAWPGASLGDAGPYGWPGADFMDAAQPAWNSADPNMREVPIAMPPGSPPGRFPGRRPVVRDRLRAGRSVARAAPPDVAGPPETERERHARLLSEELRLGGFSSLGALVCGDEDVRGCGELVYTAIEEVLTQCEGWSEEGSTWSALLAYGQRTNKLPACVVEALSEQYPEAERFGWPRARPPRGVGLAPGSAWPATHRTGAAQGSSPLPGPGRAPRTLRSQTLARTLLLSNPVSLLYGSPRADGSADVWGSSWTAVFRLRRTRDSLRLVDYLARDFTAIAADRFHGAYGLVTTENVFVIALANALRAYHVVYDADEEGRIAEGLHIVTIPEGNVRGVCALQSGVIAFVSDLGLVGVTRSDFWRGGADARVPTLHLEGSVSNSIACHGDSAYVVTSEYLYRVDYDGGELIIRWKTAYEQSGRKEKRSRGGAGLTVDGRSANGSLRERRLDDSFIKQAEDLNIFEEGLESSAGAGMRLGEGSGSTPSLMGDLANGDAGFVVITDSSAVMHVVVVDARTGSVVAAAPAPLVPPGQHPSRAESEQSVLVSGWRFAVVSNTPEDVGAETPPERRFAPDTDSQPVINAIQAPHILDNPEAASAFRLGSHLGLGAAGSVLRLAPGGASVAPVLEARVKPGVDAFEFSPITNELRRVWHARVALPNGIPAAGARAGVLYGVGLRGADWTLEALDWWTGKALWTLPLARGILGNTVYGATQIGPDGEILIGTLGGVIRVYIPNTDEDAQGVS